MSRKSKKKNITNAIAVCTYTRNKNGNGGIALAKNEKLAIQISENKENFALDGDEIEVSYKSIGSNKVIGEITKIISHNTTNLIGTPFKHRDKVLLRVPSPKFGNYLVYVNTEGNCPEFKETELFNTAIIRYPTNSEPFFEVNMLTSLGLQGEEKAFIAQTIIEANVPTTFSQAVLDQANKYRDKVLPSDLIGRLDLRQLPFVTIDGEDAKDFDDAVYCEHDNSIFTLYVAIADVANYVTDESPLDIEAYERGTSIYFPRQVIPMLPEQLSNGLCSLNPDKERLVICCKIKIDELGNILNYELANAVINSHARLTYRQVQGWIDDTTTIPAELRDNITNLYSIFKSLLLSRSVRGAIDFDTEEAYFDFDSDGEVSGLYPRVRLDSHKLIEECMLAANVCVADFMLKNTHPCLFRIHDKPSEDKFNALKAYLNSMAIEFDISYVSLTPIDYMNLLNSVKNHSQFKVIQQIVLRSLQLAIYSPNNVGHFGLSYKHYLHFTSPIRRYPDLLVHRIIKSILKGKRYQFSHPIEQMGEQTSFTERRAEELGRKVDAFYKCKYAMRHVGSTFTGYVTSVTNFGLFVYMPELMLDGLVHITELGDDYFIFDEVKQMLVGKASGTRFANGQQLKVLIAAVNMSRLYIDLSIPNESGS
jgi:ribonuclease R